jgi:hypothetical protein
MRIDDVSGRDIWQECRESQIHIKGHDIIHKTSESVFISRKQKELRTKEAKRGSSFSYLILC